MTLRKELKRRTIWRTNRIERITNSTLAPRCKILYARTASASSNTNIAFIPFVVEEYAQKEHTQYVKTHSIQTYMNGITLRWGNLGKRMTRLTVKMRYQPVFGPPSRVINSMRLPPKVDAVDTFKTKYNSAVLEHIVLKDTARLIIPPRIVLRDVERAIRQIEQMAREKGLY